MSNTDRTTREFTLTWTLDSPPAEVFRAWTDPDHLDWFYNDDNPIPSEPIELDLRVGGIWRQHMVIDESTAYVTGGVYREIVRDEKLVFAWVRGGRESLSCDRAQPRPALGHVNEGGQTWRWTRSTSSAGRPMRSRRSRRRRPGTGAEPPAPGVQVRRIKTRHERL